MSTAAGTVVTDVLKQVRDVGGNAHSRASTLEIISHSQRVINAIVKSVVRTQTLTTQPRQLFYSVSLIFTDYVKAVAVKHNNQNLLQTSFKALRNSNPNWPRRLGSVPSFFVPFGINQLIIYPVPAESTTVELTYVKDTGVIPGEATAMQLPDHNIQLVKDLAATTLFLRQRDFAQAQVMISNFTDRLKRQRNE